MKTRQARFLFSASLAVLAGLAASAAAHGQALPSGGIVRAGDAEIVTTATDVTTIRQGSDRAIIDWADFSIGRGSSVRFENGSGATLNRVRGSAVSSIDGLISATGSVYLLNPNGVLIGRDGIVDVGGSFVASTREINDAYFLSGNGLALSGQSGGSIVNLGKVGALGGDIVMAARTVRNAGRISAPGGAVGLLSGQQVTLRDISLDRGKFAVALGSGDGSVTNAGDIRAAMVELRANGGNIFALAGNTGDAITATGVSRHDGRVILFAERGAATVEGVIEADKVDGSGGFIETSGDSVDVSGAMIRAHDWLIDPEDITIDDALASTVNSALGAGTNVTLQTTATAASPSGDGNEATGHGDITVNSALTWSTGATLTLDAYDSIHVKAPITVSGSGGVVLTTGEGGDYDFGLISSGFQGKLAYTGSGGSLSINGVSYTLLYSMNDLAAIGNSPVGGYFHGKFALAQALDAAGNTYTAAVVPNVLEGVFTGLGNTISNLTIDAPYGYVGLFTHVDTTGVSKSQLRDVGLVGGSVAGGGDNVGALSGRMTHSDILHVYSTVDVTGNGLAAYIGGLVGNAGDVDIIESFSTGDVSADGNYVGGLAGWLSLFGSSIRSYATGAVTGTSSVGGLVGWLRNGGDITDSYAWGNVSGSGSVGGLVGFMDDSAANSPSVVTSYSTGLVAGSGGKGGLVGNNNVSSVNVTNSYWNTQTSGLATSDGGTGLTTAQLQGATLPSGFSSSVWSTADGFYPVLSALGGVSGQTISGFVYDTDGTTPLAGVNVDVYTGGSLLNSGVSAGANGYYYTTAAAGTVTGTTKLGAIAWLPATGSAAADALTYTDRPSISEGDVVDLNLYLGERRYGTVGTTLSGLISDLASTFGGSLADFQAALVDSPIALSANNALGFTFDTALTLTGDTTVATPGDLTISSAVDGAYSFNLTSSGGAIALNADLGALTALTGVTMTGVGNISLGGDITTQSVQGLVGSIYDGYFETGGIIDGEAVPNSEQLAYFDSATLLSGYSQFDGAFSAINTATMGSNISDNYSVKFIGFFKPNVTGEYHFQTGSDDASHIWVGNSGETVSSLAGRLSYDDAIVYNPGIHPVEVLEGSAGLLNAGEYYPILVYFGESGGGDELTVKFKGPTDADFTSNGSGVYFGSPTPRGTGAIAFNNPVSLTNDVAIVSTGNLTLAGTVDGNHSLSLDVGSNAMSIDHEIGGSSSLASLSIKSGPLTVNSDVHATGLVKLQSLGDLTIGEAASVQSAASNSTAANAAMILAANGSFINNGTGLNISTPNGRWLIYSQAMGDSSSLPSNNDFGDLAGKNFYGDTYDFIDGTFTSAPNSGNRYVYGYQPTLTVTADTKDIEYNGSQQANSYAVTGLLENGDITADAYSGTPGGLTSISKELGDYEITPTLGTLTSDLNYAFDFASGILTIIPKTLTTTISAGLTGAVAKVYDGTNRAVLQSSQFALTGGIDGEDVSLELPTVAYYDNENVGTAKLVTTNVSLKGANKDNYVLANSIISANIGTITKRPLDVALVGDITKTYDGTRVARLSAANYTITGILPGDAVVLNDLRSGTYDTDSAGTGKLVMVTGLRLSGGDAGNYSIPSSISGKVGTVDPKTITVRLTGSTSKVYDGTLVARLASSNLVMSGAVTGDSLAVTSVGSATYDTKNAGTGKMVSVTLALTGVDKGNYRLALPTVSAPIGIITARPLTLTLKGSVTVPGGTATTIRLDQSNISLSGLVMGDAVLVSAVSLGAVKNVKNGAYVTIQVPAKNVQIVGPDARNYTLSGTTTGRVRVIY